MTTETVQPQLKESIPTCQECGKQKRLYKDGVCLGCYGLVMLKKTAWPDGQPVWVTCPQCNIEWSKLKENGLCYDCDEAKMNKFLQEKANNERLIRIFGSFRTANHYTFVNFRVTSGTEEAFEFCKNFKTTADNLYLWGQCGTGKTHLAYAVAKANFLTGRKVVITSPMRMVDTFRTKSDLEKEDRMEDFTECELLLIDDLGISKHTDFAIEILCELLNRRSLQMKNGLIITSNLSLDQLSHKNRDDRITSRLAGLCRVINVTGNDYRLNKVERGCKID